MDNYSFEKYWKHFAQMVKFLILDQYLRSFTIFIRTWLLYIGVHRLSESLTYQSDVSMQSDERLLTSYKTRNTYLNLSPWEPTFDISTFYFLIIINNIQETDFQKWKQWNKFSSETKCTTRLFHFHQLSMTS
jgi:hypothetical protein